MSVAAERDPAAPAPDTAPAPAIARHPHALAVLGPVLSARAAPSHAYLFHGPAGTGKREAALALAAALLAEGSPDPAGASERVRRMAHPDLTWVRPSGAAEMLVSDIAEPVVAAAARTPFESARRVFVIEAAETMNDQAANRMLKTLEEPPSFAHLVLLTDRLPDVLETIASRCQHVRFDPLPAELIAAGLGERAPAEALACAGLAQGDAGLAAHLCSPAGGALRAGAEALARAPFLGTTDGRPWLGLLDGAREAGERAGERFAERLAGELELLPERERKRHEREASDARRRGERRARTRTLDLGLGLAELWWRDLLCVREGAHEVLFACDRLAELEQDADGTGAEALREGIALIGETRLHLLLNVSEELALEALSFRLLDLVQGG